jgi:hypothetical protein
MILVSHIVTNLFCFNFKKTNLNFLDDFSSYLTLSFAIVFNLLLDLFDLFSLIFLYFLQLFLHILKKKLFILGIL